MGAAPLEAERGEVEEPAAADAVTAQLEDLRFKSPLESAAADIEAARRRAPVQWPAFLEQLRTGDLLLWSGDDSLGAKVLRWGAGGACVHVGLVIRDASSLSPLLAERLGSRPMVLHSTVALGTPNVWTREVCDGVQLTELSEFGPGGRASGRYGTLRWRRQLEDLWTEARATTMTETLLQTACAPYPSDLWTVARLGLGSEAGGRWRATDAFTCSSLVGYVYSRLGFLADSTRWSLLLPSHFSALHAPDDAPELRVRLDLEVEVGTRQLSP